MKKYYETINIVFLHDERLYGTVESMGAYFSKVKYTIDGIEQEKIFANEDFNVMDEMTFEHIEEEN